MDESRDSQHGSCRRLRKSALGLCALTLAGLGAVWPPSPLPPAHRASSLRMAASARPKPMVFSPHQPLRFEENVGQTDRRADFLARGLGYTVFLTRRGAVLALAPGQKSKVKSQKLLVTGHSPLATEVVRLKLVGAKQAAEAKANVVTHDA